MVEDFGFRPPDDGQVAADDARPRPLEDAGEVQAWHLGSLHGSLSNDASNKWRNNTAVNRPPLTRRAASTARWTRSLLRSDLVPCRGA